MKFKALDGRIIGVDLKKRNIVQSRSQCQESLRELLEEIYDRRDILEEFPIPGERLFLDFFIPKRSIAFEFHGQQHFKYNPHFHVDRRAFLQQKERDRRKREWCDLNEITLVEIQDKQISLEDLKQKIMNSLRAET